jgi:cytochrome b561
MISSQPTTRYSLPARLLHWVIAAVVPIQIYLGYAAEWESDRRESFRLIQQHYQLGLLIFGLMLLRIFWRVGYGTPPHPKDEPRWRRLTANTVHWLLYALLLTMPVSGYVIWVWMDVPMNAFGFLELPRLFTPPIEDETGRAAAWYVHYYSSWLVIALIIIHVGAASWHQFVRRDGSVVATMV